MRFRKLGRTGIDVSIVGFGASGNFGAMTGGREEDAGTLIRRALDLGINLIDTAANYGDSECILGRALAVIPRDRYFLNSKYFPLDEDGRVISPADVRASIERSLRRLRCGHLDVLQIHGVRPGNYREIVHHHLAELAAMKDEGLFRFLGITETIRLDPWHETLENALADNHFDTAMVAYSLLSPTPERSVLPKCANSSVGVIVMTAVRRALSQPEILQTVMERYRKERRRADGLWYEDVNLNWILSEKTPTLAAAGYQYALSHPAVATVLTGTTDPNHLEANVRAALGPPLDPEHIARLRRIFMPANGYEPWSTFDL